MTLLKTAAVAFAFAISTVSLGAPAQAGCIKGAIVGGLAGKLVGHGYAGAAAGCAYGHYKTNRDVRRDSDLQNGRSAGRDGRY